MKKLTRSLPVIAAAIQEGSSALEISPDGHSVRRLASLPEVDLDEVRRRTVMADNLPDNATIEQVIEMFSPAGEVVMARIRKPEAPEPLLTRGLKGDVAKTNRTYALIEFATPDQAHQAVKLLHEPDNWRTGLRVRRLLAGGVKHAQQGKKKKQSQQAEHAELDGQGAVDTTSGGEGCSVGVEKKEGEASPSGGPSEGGTPEPGTGHGKAKHPKLPWNTEKKRNKSEYAAWASAGAAQQAKQAAGGGKGATDDGGHGGSSAGGASSGTAGGVGRVRMPVAPDGTRGFAMGRGKALTPPPPGLVSPV